MLVIESAPDTRGHIQDVIEHDGHHVRLASSFDEAIEQGDWQEIDVILLDTELACGDAREILPRLRRLAPHAAIVYAASNPNVEDAVQTLREGAYDYLLKPINADILRATLLRISQLSYTRASLKLETDARQYAENQHRLLAEAIAHLGEGVVITKTEFNGSCPRIVFVNEAICRITGYHKTELLGETPEIFHGENTDSQSVEEVSEAIHARRPFQGELLFYRKDGTTYDAEIICTPMIDSEGRCTNYVSIHRDITEKIRSARQLSERESRLRAILQTATDAIVTIDPKGMIVGVNPATLRIFGYEERELIGTNVSILMPEPYRSEHDDYLSRYLRTGEARIIGIGREVIAKKKDGSTFPVHLAVSRIDAPPLFTGIIRDISALKELQKQVLEIAAEEDRRIGHELHDSVQQQLTGLGLLSQTVAEMLSDSNDWEARCQPTVAKVARLADRVARGISEAAREVHNLSRGLVPVEIDAEGLRAALEELAERVSIQYGVVCACEFRGDINLTNNFVATHLFRIVQEAVTNAMKHGDASRIDIRLVGTDRTISLEVIDNGRGIQTGTLSNLGTGLKIMQYRSSLIGGVIKIVPGPDGGTLVNCTVSREGNLEVTH
ncbi:Sensor protein FixL [Bremerella volcania]|uniref:Sensor protein FixL n=1 Tax=Bremerella volcania TaxID=2527984 RepID=A0A518C993_9BACT|nr:Sensor protein FixL [Bremerella volcania]